MNEEKVRKIVLGAMLAALVCLATCVFAFPLPGNGFANLGDCFVIGAGWLLGPLWGAAAGGIGAALADLFLGFGVYAPATLVIKGLMAATAYGVGTGVRKKMPERRVASVAVSAVAAELAMILGYFVFECALYGGAVAVVDIPGNAGQAAVGIVAGTLVVSALERIQGKKVR